ncbi:phosphoglycerate dehydrogenase [bacterium]|nr:phosphoglycerate dehydrogenase [bacterium]
MKILVSDALSEKGLDALKQNPEFKVDVKTKMPLSELISSIGEYDGLLIRSGTKVTKEVINAADKLKVIGRAGVGVDNIDVAAATRKSIIVMNTPSANSISAAEHTMSLLLALARNVPQASNSLKKGEWKRKDFMGSEVFNKILGIVGLGRIGTEVAKRAQSFAMEIIVCDPFISQEYAQKLGIKLVDFDNLIKQADYITFHIPLTPETKHLINKDTFAKMKKGVRIINCARGGIIDEEALVSAVKEGIVKGAALDVFEKEPLGESPLLNVDNIIITPHLGAFTEEAQVNVSVDIVKGVVDYLKNAIINNAVNVPAVDPQILEEIRPYLELAEKLGKLSSQIIEGRLQEASIQYSGEIINYNLTPITVAFTKGLLEPILEEDINFVNASIIAQERKIKIVESKTSQVENFTNLVSIKLKTDKGQVLVSGTLFSKNDPRIVEINNFRLDAAIEGFMLVCSNLDKPGVVGHIGNILGENQINISSMQVGRKKVKGQAITVVNVENSISNDVLEKLKKHDKITDVKMVKL